MKKNIDAMNHPTKVKESIGERIYTIVVYLLLILISATIILPLLHIISGSFSDPMQLLTDNVSFWPKGFTTSMYEKVLKDASIWTGYLNTILYTVLGTLISVTLTACAAYPLSRKDLFGRNIFISLFIFTMFFNGGMIHDERKNNRIFVDIVQQSHSKMRKSFVRFVSKNVAISKRT